MADPTSAVSTSTATAVEVATTTIQPPSTSQPRCFDADTLRAIVASNSLEEALRRNEEACLAAQRLNGVVQSNPGSPAQTQTTTEWTPFVLADCPKSALDGLCTATETRNPFEFIVVTSLFSSPQQ